MGAAILVGSFILLVAIRVPIAFSLGISAILAALYEGVPLSALATRMADGLNSFSLMAIPFFILAGQIMADGKMAQRLVRMASAVWGMVRGGLAMINCQAGMMFGAVSGSSVAATTSIGTILVPLMEEHGYDRDFSVAITVTSSTQGLVIPPSHNAIIYAAAAGGGISIASLFLAGVVPGALVGVALMIASYFIAKSRGYPREQEVTVAEGFRIIIEGIPAMMVGVIILGGVLSGTFTAVEASAIAVVYAIALVFLAKRNWYAFGALAAAAVVAFLLRTTGIGCALGLLSLLFVSDRTLDPRDLWSLLQRSVRTNSIVMLLIAASSAFAYMLTILQVPEAVARAILGVSENPVVVMLLINVLLLIVGTMMDMAPAILVLTPILLGIVTSIGVDPVHFGIIMMLNLGIGLCTPPVGATLFVGCAIGKIKIEQVIKPLLKLYPPMIVVLMLVTYVPKLAMALPEMALGGGVPPEVKLVAKGAGLALVASWVLVWAGSRAFKLARPYFGRITFASLAGVAVVWAGTGLLAGPAGLPVGAALAIALPVALPVVKAIFADTWARAAGAWVLLAAAQPLLLPFLPHAL